MSGQVNGEYEVTWIGDLENEDPVDGNIDVLVRFPTGETYTATLFTIQNLQTLLDMYKVTGECASGLYVWATDMIVVERLTEDVIMRCIADLRRAGEFAAAFRRVEPQVDDAR